MNDQTTFQNVFQNPHICPECGKQQEMKCGFGYVWYLACPDPNCKSNKQEYRADSNSGV